MKNRRGKFSITLGLLLIAAALFLTAFNLYDGLRAEKEAVLAAGRLEELMPAPRTPVTEVIPEKAPDSAEEIELPDYVLNPEMEMPVAEVDGVEYIGTVRVPALGLDLPVISRWSYPNLRIAPCRYEGSAYLDNLILAAHNYGSHFGNLKTLSQGDTVIFTDMDGNAFYYEVAVLETLKPTAVEEMESGGWDLTLFTCTIGGASRVTVRCERAESRELTP